MQGANTNTALERVLRSGIIPILRGNFGKDFVVMVARAVAAEGIEVLEVTMNSTGALELIRAIRAAVGSEILVGAGTVRTVEQLHAAREAGAEFSIAPNLDRETLEAAKKEDVLHLPGVLTPTEVQQAVTYGAAAVKLYPIDNLGADYLKAIRAPLDDVLFIPTGGVTTKNIADFRKAGAAAVGVASSLVKGADQKEFEIRQRARELRSAWLSARPVNKE